jgi:heme/copper-type cytochrome/quinol oxidase subunit 4
LITLNHSLPDESGLRSRANKRTSSFSTAASELGTGTRRQPVCFSTFLDISQHFQANCRNFRDRGGCAPGVPAAPGDPAVAANNRLEFLFLNLGHFYDHLLILIYATVAALVLPAAFDMSYAELIFVLSFSVAAAAIPLVAFLHGTTGFDGMFTAMAVIAAVILLCVLALPRAGVTAAPAPSPAS